MSGREERESRCLWHHVVNTVMEGNPRNVETRTMGTRKAWKIREAHPENMAPGWGLKDSSGDQVKPWGSSMETQTEGEY